MTRVPGFDASGAQRLQESCGSRKMVDDFVVRLTIIGMLEEVRDPGLI